MAIDPANARVADATNLANAQDKSGASPGGDYQTFLKMLTAQIKNQDPLNPMEGSDFAVQLATFSGVEQQVRTNDLLLKLAESSSQTDLLGLSSWIGKEVRTTDFVHFSGKEITLQLSPPAGAEKVYLITLDEWGREIGKEEVGVGTGEVDWQGRYADNTALTAGLYRFELEGHQGDKPMPRQKVSAYSKVLGVQTNNGTPELLMAGGAKTSVQAVTSVRESPPS